MTGMPGRTEERRLITSLFIDVVGSTELTVKLGPERLKAALDQSFAELRGIIQGEGGTVEKYIGDAIYALFGAPIAHPDDPERALRAAAGARTWAASRASAEIPFGVRVGLETGEAIVDLAAAADTKQQMSVGMVVNTAARLQQRAEPGQVLVGPVAHDATAEIAEFTALGPLDLKGLGTLSVWALDAIRGTAARRRLPFVGRTSELELLRLAHRRARKRSVLALVSGPPGQGKTRLVDEFLAGQSGLRVLAARCRPGGEVGALAPLRELLVGDRSEDALDQLVAEAIPDESARERVRGALGHSAGIRASAALASIGADERADEILDAWRRLVRGLAAHAPLALWIEDVHWAAPEVVALVDRLSLTGEPVLVIATARPEFAEEAGLRPSGDRFFIELEALEQDDARALAASAGRAEAETRAGGNPLFIIELARARDPGSDLPLTLQGALGARLDDLGAEDRALLTCGAVAGETFTAAEAALLAGRDTSGATRALARLAERQYLDAMDGRFRFHHSLLRDVAYSRLLVADRRRLHARYAREGHTEDPEILAHHWWAALGGEDARWVWIGGPDLAAMRREATAAHIAAGRQQAALFAMDRAAALLDRAYVLADGDRERAEAKHALADAYSQAFRADESWAAYHDARDHYAAAGDVPAEVYIGALRVHMRLGAFHTVPNKDAVTALAAEGITAARHSGDPGILARALVYSSFKDMDPGAEAADPELMNEALRLSVDSDAATRREILGWYANDLGRRFEIDKALAVLNEIDALPGQIGELDRLEHLRGRAVIAFRGGRLEQVRSIAEAGRALSRHMGPHLRTHADVWVSHAAVARGDWDVVLRLAEETDALMRSATTTAFCTSAVAILSNGALVQVRAGHVDDARALARRMRAITYDAESTAAFEAFSLVLTGERFDLAGMRRGHPIGQMQLAAATVIGRDHPTALALAGELEGQSRGGARFYAALADAVREEVDRDRNGTVPTHALLKGIGYVGWSEILGMRAGK